MKKVMEIFKRDLCRLRKTPAAIIVAVGMCIIPALYAWFNIAANRDPYGNTANIKVAVANNDVGAENKKRTLDAGRQILDQMEENDDLGWVFTDEEDAVNGVKSGKYYAAIVIPETFSADLLQIEDGTLGNPEIKYYVNEKRNAVAPKITNTGSTTVQNKIEEEFYKVASEAIAEELQSVGGSLADNLETTNDNILSMIADARKNFQDYQTVLANVESTIAKSNAQIAHTQTTLDQAISAANSGSKSFKEAKELIKSSRKNVRAFGATFDQSMSDGETLLTDIQTTASKNLGGLETTAQQMNTLMGALKGTAESIDTDSSNSIQALDGTITALNAKLQYLQGLPTPDQATLYQIGYLQEVIKQLTESKTALEGLQKQNGDVLTQIEEMQGSTGTLNHIMTDMSTTRKDSEKLLAQGKTTLRDLRSGLNQNLMPGLSSSLDTVSGLTGDMKTTLKDVAATANQMKGLLNELDASLTSGSEALKQTGNSLSLVDERLAGLQSDLETLRASDAYQEILDLQDIDPDAVSKFMTSPIQLNSTTFYEMEDYGSGMTPFYTNLALWVGGMVLIAIMKQEVDEDEKVKKFTLRQAYFGRQMIFILLSVIQSLIVCLGDLYLLKVQCVHRGLFILTGVVAGFVYLNLIYAITAAFKHIGRAIFVFLVIIQIPGSTGTFPVEMMGGFYQAIYRLMPFTYSNGAMREAIGGLYYNTYLKDMGILAAYLLLALLIGLVLRPMLLNLNAMFDRKLKEADLIIYEEHDKTDDCPPELIAAALRRDPQMREEFRERAERFEKTYKRRKRIGFLLMAVVPLIFLILMFSVESKLIYLVLWIATLIGLSLYLIWLEYHHERMQKQLQLDGLSESELLAAMKEERA